MKTKKILFLALLCLFMLIASSLLSACSDKKNEATSEPEATAGAETSDTTEIQAKDFAMIELHLHLDGSLSVDSVKELAAIEGVTLPEEDAEIRNLLQVDDYCRDLNEYLEKFDLTVALLQSKESISTAVYNLEKELQEQGVLYAEIRFAPQLHLAKGLTQAEVIEAAIDGMNRCDFKSNLILCCMRGDDNHELNLETVRLAPNYLGKGVCALDIAGAEALFPTENFEDIFALARELGVPFTIHAGEADGPSSVYTALSYGTKRIGHGVRSIEDPFLVEKLVLEGITLELCPTSNLNTKIYDSIEDYPLPELIDAGVRVTINSDNMIVSNTCIEKELQKVIDAFDLTEDQLKTIVGNAIDASFADEETKAWLRGELEKR